MEDKVEEAVDRFMEEWGEGRAFHEKLVPQLENALHHAITAAGHDEGFRKRMDDSPETWPWKSSPMNTTGWPLP